MINSIATSAINIIALIILSRMVYSNYILVSQRKKAFFYGIILTIIVILAEIGTIVADSSDAALHNLNLVSNVIGFALTPFIPIVLLTIFDSKVLQGRLYLMLPALINGLAAVLSPVYGFLFYVDADNQYTRGNLFFLFVAVYIIHFIFLIIVSMHQGRRQLFSLQWRLAGLALFVVAGTSIQLAFPSVYASWHIVTLSLFLYYILLSEYDGRFDSLTGLYNRSAFEKDIRFLKKRQQYTVVVMDLNDFKIINDTFGHEYGDAVLQQVTAIIRDSFDRDCISYRIGGDEFCVLCKNSDQEKIAYQLKAMTIRLARERKAGRNLPTVAYGSSTSQTDLSDIQAMLKAADAEMYIYKQQVKANKQ